MTKEGTILKWKSLQLQLAIFEKMYRKDLEEYEQQEKTKLVTKYLKLLDPEATLIWCRNGDICHIAKPCADLSGSGDAQLAKGVFKSSGELILIQRKQCPFKPHHYNVIEGCIKCMSFVVTEKNYDWDTAKHLKQWDEEE